MRQLMATIECGKNNYSAYIDGVGVAVTGKTIEEIEVRMKEAVSFYIESCKEDGGMVPDELNGEYELAFKMDVQTMLEYYDGVLGKACLEKVTGINQKQLWHYASGKVKPREKQRERINKGLHNLGRELLLVNV